MENEIKIIEDNAQTVYISTPETSYGIFCYNSLGDLFLNSDWGFYCHAWRSFGDNFKEFLSSLSTDYLVGKFEINMNTQQRKDFKGRRKEAVYKLAELFIKSLKEDLK